MKHLITCVFLFFSMVQFGFGQTAIGFKVGANIANINLNDDYPGVQNSSRIGYQAGIIIQRELTSKVYIRPEVFYSLKGYKLEDGQSTRVGFNYINIPILVGYKLATKFSAFLGPQLGLLGPVYGTDKNNGRSKNLNSFIDYNNLDFGLAAGVNYVLTPKLNLDLRYTNGFTTILVTDLVDSSGNTTEIDALKNNKSLEVSLNYFFKNR